MPTYNPPYMTLLSPNNSLVLTQQPDTTQLIQADVVVPVVMYMDDVPRGLTGFASGDCVAFDRRFLTFKYLTSQAKLGPVPPAGTYVRYLATLAGLLGKLPTYNPATDGNGVSAPTEGGAITFPLAKMVATGLYVQVACPVRYVPPSSAPTAGGANPVLSLPASGYYLSGAVGEKMLPGSEIGFDRNRVAYSTSSPIAIVGLPDPSYYLHLVRVDGIIWAEPIVVVPSSRILLITLVVLHPQLRIPDNRQSTAFSLVSRATGWTPTEFQFAQGPTARVDALRTVWLPSTSLTTLEYSKLPGATLNTLNPISSVLSTDGTTVAAFGETAIRRVLTDAGLSGDALRESPYYVGVRARDAEGESGWVVYRIFPRL